MGRQVQINTIIFFEIDPVVKNTRNDRSYRHCFEIVQCNKCKIQKVFKYLEVLNAQYCTCITYIHVYVCV